MNDQVYNVYITDFQLHTIKPQHPNSWFRAIMKSIKNQKEERAYINNDGKQFSLAFSEKVIQEIEQAKASGKKIRLVIPESGVPIYASKDLKEFLEARKNRIIKRI